MKNMWEDSKGMEGVFRSMGAVTERKDELVKAVRREPANIRHCPQRFL